MIQVGLVPTVGKSDQLHLKHLTRCNDVASVKCLFQYRLIIKNKALWVFPQVFVSSLTC